MFNRKNQIKIREKGGNKVKRVFVCFVMLSTFLALSVVVSSNAYAVHKGAGGLDCSGCHTMHNSQQNATMGGTPTNKLLKGTSNEALCLSCHDTAGSQYTTYSATVPAVKGAPAGTPAAGNFTSLDGTTDAAGQLNKGKGHNLGEGANTVTPAGGTAITNFDCTNCHDSHGVGASDTATVSKFRNLKFTPTGSTGTAPAVIRATPDEGTLSSAVYPESSYKYGSTTAGVSNVSQWCGTCHNNFYGDANTNAASPYKRHPSGKPLSAVASATYLAETAANRFPCEDTTGNTANTGPEGNDANDQVFCLSCHKSHATANADALRWDYAGVAQSSTTTSACQQCHNK